MTNSEKPQVSESPRVPLHIRFLLSMKMGVLRKLAHILFVSLVLSLFVVYALESMLPSTDDATPIVLFNSLEFYIVIFVSLSLMYIDATLGMGYGTTLTPILILLGHNPLEVIPALLVAQWLSGIAAGLSHQSAGNIDLSAGSSHLKITLILSACGIIGALGAVKIAISVDPDILTTVIGVLVFIVGIVIFFTRNKQFKFSWHKIIFLGLIASFNKGISAGGYGPIVTGGQMLSGVGGKQAIGITAISEGLTCLIAVMGFLASGTVHDLSMAYPLLIGAMLSVPLSAYTVRSMTVGKLITLIALITIILGIVTAHKGIQNLLA